MAARAKRVIRPPMIASEGLGSQRFRAFAGLGVFCRLRRVDAMAYIDGRPGGSGSGMAHEPKAMVNRRGRNHGK